jgi:hypothetical protein
MDKLAEEKGCTKKADASLTHDQPNRLFVNLKEDGKYQCLIGGKGVSGEFKYDCSTTEDAQYILGFIVQLLGKNQPSSSKNGPLFSNGDQC